MPKTYAKKGRFARAPSARPEPSLRRTFDRGKPFQRLEITMKRVAAAIVAGLLSVSAAAAQSTGTSDAKPETACTTSPAATTGSGEEKTANSMSVEKSAVLPEAGGANSAAPTVQSGGKPLKVSPGLPAGTQSPNSASAWRCFEPCQRLSPVHPWIISGRASCAPPSSLMLSLPLANSMSSSASPRSADLIVAPPSRPIPACAVRRINSLMKAALTPLVRRTASSIRVSSSRRPLP